jgi:Rhodopirellula transposase DDE domain
VNHLPPGTSKWNHIEHRLSAFITMNWGGKPLVSYPAIIQLIASTTTNTRLTVTCQLDANAYEKGIKVSDDEMASLNVKPASFHSEWNCNIAPRRPNG